MGYVPYFMMHTLIPHTGIMDYIICCFEKKIFLIKTFELRKVSKLYVIILYGHLCFLDVLRPFVALTRRFAKFISFYHSVTSLGFE